MTKTRAAWLLAGVCAWHLVLSLNSLRLPLMTDEGEYAYAARVWSAGGLPYRDAYLQKPPMIAFFYRLVQGVSDAPAAPRVLALLAVWGACILLYAATPRRWRPAARLAGPAILASSTALPVGDYSFPANTEVFVVLFTTAAFYFLSRFWASGRRPRDAAFCGLALGAALATKQTAAWTLLGFGVLAAWRPGKRADWKALAACLAAAAVIPALWAAYFAARGGLGELLDQTWARNRAYGSIVVGTEALGLQLRWFASTLAPRLAWGLWPAAALAAYGCAERFSEERLSDAAAAVWFGASTAGAITGLFLFPHYFLQAAPALAALAGVGVERLGARAGARRAAWAAALAALWPAAAFAAPLFSDSGPMLARRLLFPNPLYEARAIGVFAATRTTPEEPIYVFGSEAQIYEYARRRCATKHEVVYSLTMFPLERADIVDELAAFDRARPKVVVYSAQPFSAIIGSPLGAEFRDEIRRRLERDYVWVGQSRISEKGGGTNLGAAAFRGLRPDWNDEDCLFVFERKPGRP